MNVLVNKRWVLCFALIVSVAYFSNAQRTVTREVEVINGGSSTSSNPSVTYDSQGRPVRNRSNGGKDSLQKRDQFADSITIFYKYFDSSASRTFDSSVNDFNKRFPKSSTYIDLGNFGTATHSLLFAPILKAGWDVGFHQYDFYNFTIENTRFFQTTRPYTELAYILGSKSEQTIHLLHTQNKKSNFNFAFEYQFINSPGSFKNQNNNHSNLRLNANYQTKNRKYNALFILVTNKNVSSESGGLRDPKLLDSLSFNNPYQLESRLGASGAFSQNPFNTNISTGNKYKNSTFLFRHSYDLGKVDSIMNHEDSTYNKIFYSRLRLQHTFSYSKYNYEFVDAYVDTANYRKYFGVKLLNNNSINMFNNWKLLSNDFSILTFPDKNNLSQFLKVGATVQNIKGTLGTIFTKDYNIFFNGEYRNRTKNKIWDLEATGAFYVNGLNAGDYQVYASIKRQLSKKVGFLQLTFQNVNRKPSTIFNQQNNFLVTSYDVSKKENTTCFSALYENPKQQFKLYGNYYLVTNYAYFDSFLVAKQDATLFNVLHVAAEKMVKLKKHWNWYVEINAQQSTANAPVNLPLLVTRNRLAFEGNFFTNLFLSTGLELRYYTNYKAAGYSPFTGQFYYQENYYVANRPEINAYLNFRIKSFKAFVRMENLNTLIPGNGKYNFTRENYAQNAMWTRLGIWWNFVN